MRDNHNAIETNVALHEAGIGLSMSLWRVSYSAAAPRLGESEHVRNGCADKCL